MTRLRVTNYELSGVRAYCTQADKADLTMPTLSGNLTNYFFAIFLVFLVFVGGSLFAQESEPYTVSEEFLEMEERSLRPRSVTPEPKFLTSGTSARWMGFYFGVGFRQVWLQTAGSDSDDVEILAEDGAANGIGVNLGYFWDEQVLEYERQVSIVTASQPLNDQAGLTGTTGQRLEVIQNNLWYARFPKIRRDFYLHYGAGLQFSKTRFVSTGENPPYADETSLILGAGGAYFLTPNFLLLYRFSAGRQIPVRLAFFNNSDPLLKQSRLHTIYLNYYFPL